MPVSVERLTPDMIGKWLVTTRGSQHIWDLDNMTYCRINTSGKNPMDFDDKTFQITAVAVWPRVGFVSKVYYDDPNYPNDLEQWRQSSTIKSIEQIL